MHAVFGRKCTDLDPKIEELRLKAVFPPIPTTIGTPSLFTAFPREPIPEAEWYGQYGSGIRVALNALRAENAELRARISALERLIV